MENLYLRVSGSCGNAGRIFIAENYLEDEYGLPLTSQLANKAMLMMKDHVFRTWDDNEYVRQSRKFQERQVKRRKGNGKGKGGLKRIGNAYFGEEQTQDNDWWSEEDCVWWSKGKKSKKGLPKGKNKFPEGDSNTLHQEKGSDKDYRSCTGGLSASESPSEEGYGFPGNLMTGIQALLIPPVRLLMGMARDILHGWRR